MRACCLVLGTFRFKLGGHGSYLSAGVSIGNFHERSRRGRLCCHGTASCSCYAFETLKVTTAPVVRARARATYPYCSSLLVVVSRKYSVDGGASRKDKYCAMRFLLRFSNEFLERCMFSAYFKGEVSFVFSVDAAAAVVTVVAFVNTINATTRPNYFLCSCHRQVRQYFNDSAFYVADLEARGLCPPSDLSPFPCAEFSPSAATVKVRHTSRFPRVLHPTLGWLYSE